MNIAPRRHLASLTTDFLSAPTSQNTFIFGRGVLLDSALGILYARFKSLFRTALNHLDCGPNLCLTKEES